MKAVIITEKNTDFLCTRFGIVDVGDQFPIGYILVTDFGNDETFSVLSPVNFDLEFEQTGTTLLNDFFEIRAKA
jgi:hypothetical protein